MTPDTALLFQRTYAPERFLDTLKFILRLETDAALAAILDISAPSISKIRHRKIPVTSDLLLAAHECTGLSIRDLRALMGDIKTRYWVGTLTRSANLYRDRQSKTKQWSGQRPCRKPKIEIGA